MTTTDQAIAAATRLAKSAALRDLGTESCPYPADGTNNEKAARRAFYTEYLRLRPVTGTNLSDDLDYFAYGDGDQDAALTEADFPAVPNVLYDLRALEAEGSHTGAKLKAYWVSGKGAAKIRWREDGDFERCVHHLGKYVDDPKGLCNTYHVAAVGAPPGKGH